MCWLVSSSEYSHLSRLGLDVTPLSPEEAARSVREWHGWESPSQLEPAVADVVRALGDDTARVYAQRPVAFCAVVAPVATDLRDLAEPEPPEVESHWVEVRLADEAGAPRAGEPYRVMLGDGSVRQGQLDANGVARIPGVPGTPCRWSFPSLHAGEWGRG